ncbi:oligosaccharide flippase family protein [Dermatophilaceae bacterium Sec6.4]
MTDLAVAAPPARGMARAVVALSVAEVLGKVASLVTFTVVARGLGVAGFGLFSFGLGLGLLLASISSLGLDDRLVQLSGPAPERLRQLLAALLMLRFGLGTAVLGAVLLVMLLRSGPVSWTVFCLVATGLVDTITDAFRAASASRHSQEGPAIVLVMQRFIAVALVGAALLTGQGVLAVSVAYLSASCAGAAAMSIATRRAGIRPSWTAVTRHDLLDHLRAVPVNGLNELVSMALFRIDTLLLAAIAGVVAVGHYNAAYRLLETVLFVSWSLSRVLTPSFAKPDIDRADFARTIRTGYALISALYLPYCAVLLVRGDQLVGLLFGPDFAKTHVVAWLAVTPLVFGMAHLSGSALLARRPDPIVLIASLAALVTNIALNLLLIPTWGATGAAAATSASYLVQMGINYTGLRRRVPGSTMDRSVLVAAGCAALMGLAMLAPSPVFIAVPVGAVVYLLAWDRISLRFDPTRRTMLLDFLNRRGATA